MPTAKDDPASDAYRDAIDICQRYEPSAKNFTTIQGGDYLDGKAKWLPDRGEWLATGECDAQNEYGALKHFSWNAEITIAGRVKFLALGGEVVIDK